MKDKDCKGYLELPQPTFGGIGMGSKNDEDSADLEKDKATSASIS